MRNYEINYSYLLKPDEDFLRALERKVCSEDEHIDKSIVYQGSWLKHNGILFWKGLNGEEFNRHRAKFILPQVIRDCRDCYLEGIKRDILVEYNGDSFYVMVNSSGEVRMRY